MEVEIKILRSGFLRLNLGSKELIEGMESLVGEYYSCVEVFIVVMEYSNKDTPGVKVTIKGNRLADSFRRKILLSSKEFLTSGILKKTLLKHAMVSIKDTNSGEIINGGIIDLPHQ